MTAAVLIQLIATLGPLAVPLIQDLVAVFKAHPQLPPDVIVQLVALIHSANANTIATVDADQAAHPGT